MRILSTLALALLAGLAQAQEVGPRPEMKSDNDAMMKLMVKRFEITGNKTFTVNQLYNVTQGTRGNVGYELSLTEIKGEADMITRYYKSKGHPRARAYIPVQEFKDGVVEIAVEEGVSDKIPADDKNQYFSEFIPDLPVAGDVFQNRRMVIYGYAVLDGEGEVYVVWEGNRPKLHARVPAGLPLRGTIYLPKPGRDGVTCRPFDFAPKAATPEARETFYQAREAFTATPSGRLGGTIRTAWAAPSKRGGGGVQERDDRPRGRRPAGRASRRSWTTRAP